MSTHASPSRKLVRLSRIAALWALGYGLYRGYYAVGGSVGMLGTPAVSDAQWARINGIAAVLLFVFAALPIASRRSWSRARTRAPLLALSWIVAVACVSHAAIGVVQRVSSLAGVLTIDYPFWQTIDRREADLQALFFNEPWFLTEGLLWAGMAWHGALRDSPRRRWWLGSAIVATAVATTMGILSAFGVIGRVIVG